MRSVRSVRRKCVQLEERIKNIQKEKNKVFLHIQNLKNRFLDKEISHLEYRSLLEEKRSGKSFEEWIDYYDFHIEESNHQLKKLNNIGLKSNILLSLSIIFTISFFLLLFFGNIHLTAFLIQEKEVSFTEEVSLSLSNNEDLFWTPENKGNLTSIKFSGYVEGSEDFKLFFQNYLLLDSNSLNEQTPLITGLSIIEEKIQTTQNAPEYIASR